MATYALLVAADMLETLPVAYRTIARYQTVVKVANKIDALTTKSMIQEMLRFEIHKDASKVDQVWLERAEDCPSEKD